jgi:P4 family phage/plasmid primase-like protien
MIQILGIRTYVDPRDGKTKKKDEFFDQNWRAASIQDLLQNWSSYLNQIPEAERYNIFFTQAECTHKKREFDKQWVIPFDIDGVDRFPWGDYVQAFCDTLQIPFQYVTVIFSGHGLQLMVNLKEPFTQVGYFKEKRVHYSAICDKINLTLSQRGLPGHMDRDFWKPHIFFRLPGTENRKPDKPIAQVSLLHHSRLTLDFDWEKLSGVPDVLPSHQVEPKSYGTPDTQGILKGCNFLKHCKQNQDNLNEPTWYAMLSILARLEKGAELAHEYSRGHAGYSREETEIKIEQALQSSGPRTCKNIESFYQGCRTCPNYQKVNSPISIKSKDFIETETTGFHKVSINARGVKTIGKPAYDDLRKYFERGRCYRVMGESGICYVWENTHYEILGDLYLEAFAQEKFHPKALSHMTHEFKKLVCRTNLTDPEWFTNSTDKKINFKNGVLDLRTGALGPHSSDYGFRYVLPYDYDERAKCPNFEKFLYQVTCGDQDLSDLLLEFAGYAFSGDWPWASKVLVLTGEGSNGKSTFIDVLRALAGRENYSSLTWKDMNNQTTLQLLDGKLFNLAEEAPKHALSDSTLFKNLATGGEITIRMLYKQAYAIANKTKLIFACNELPQSEDTSKGFFRRFLIVPFRAEFSEDKGNVDPLIREKLIGELPGIFNLVRRGYERLSKNRRFTEAGAAKKTLEDYQSDVDHAQRWIKENVEVMPLNGGHKYSILPEMYQVYRNEMLNSGEKPLTAVGFGKKLGRIIPEYESRAKQKKLSGKVVRVVLDVTYQSGGDV